MGVSHLSSYGLWVVDNGSKQVINFDRNMPYSQASPGPPQNVTEKLTPKMQHSATFIMCLFLSF